MSNLVKYLILLTFSWDAFSCQDPFGSPGPDASFEVAAAVPKVRVGSFNIEKLRIRPRDEARMELIALQIQDQGLDLVALQEVGSYYGLMKLAEMTGYEAVFFEGLPERNIHFGFLHRPGLGLALEYKNHRQDTYESPSGEPEHIFPRGFPVVEVKNEQGQLLFVLGIVHLKSKVVRRGIDNSDLRSRQITRVAEILEAYGEDVPLLVAGDFNSDLNQEGFDRFWQGGFVNSFDGTDVPVGERYSHVYRPRDGRDPIYQQIDGILMRSGQSPWSVHRAEVIRPDERLSDHYMVVAEISAGDPPQN